MATLIDQFKNQAGNREAFLTFLGYDANHKGNINCPCCGDKTPSCQANADGIFCHGKCGESRSFYRAIADRDGITDNEAITRIYPHLAGSTTKTASSVKRTTTKEQIKRDHEKQQKDKKRADTLESIDLMKQVRKNSKPYANHDKDSFAARKVDRPNASGIRYARCGDDVIAGIYMPGEVNVFTYENQHGESTGAEFIALNPSDHSRELKKGKTHTKSKGTRTGATCRIQEPAGATRVHLTEGVMNAATVRMAVPKGDAVMAAGTYSNLPKVTPIVSAFESLWIWADYDECGQKAANAAAKLAVEAGVSDVRIVLPPEINIGTEEKPKYADWNDLIQFEGVTEVESYYEAGGEVIGPPVQLTESEQFLADCKAKGLVINEPLRAPLSRKAFGFVGNLLTVDGISVIYAKYGVGKTFVTLDLAASVASAALNDDSIGSWSGLKVKGGSVVYCCGEGHRGFERRMHALTLANKAQPGAPLFSLPNDMHLNVMDEESVDKLVDYCRLIQLTKPHELRMIVIDTLASSSGGIDENAQMQLVVDKCAEIRQRLGGSVHIALVHHTGKDDARGARGGYALQCGVDTILRLDKVEVPGYAENADKPMERIRASVEKQKDAAKNEPLDFRMEVVDMGLDDENDPITSCVVHSVPYNPAGELISGNVSAPVKAAESSSKKELEKPQNQVKVREAFDSLGGNGAVYCKHLAKKLNISRNTLKNKYWLGNPDSLFEVRDGGLVFEIKHDKCDTAENRGVESALGWAAK